MARPEAPFVVAPVPRLPAEAIGSGIEQQIQFIWNRIVGKTNEESINNTGAMALLAEVGLDENIFVKNSV